MPSIVQELQRDAIDNNVDVSTLLRKALVVATKLHLEEFRQWVTLELEGYRRVSVPEYRKIQGQVVLVHPRFGRRPMMFDDPAMGYSVTAHEMRAPIGPLCDLLRSESSTFKLDFPPALQSLLVAPFFDAPGVPSLEIGRASIEMVLDAVRNAILKWSLRLEEDGVSGEGLSFTAGEIDIARRHARDLQPPTIIIGTMINSSIQQSSDGARLN
jgi:hypothetical protein